MMRVKLTNHIQASTTLVENEFIDKYMPEANGEYVKVYLLLLRHPGDSGEELTVSKIADILDCTEKDVLRALNYWQRLGLLECLPDRSASSVPAAASAVPSGERRTSARNITNLKERRELKELLFVAEQYLGKTLTMTDMNAITYFFDELGMSADLIEYLIEYCVENNHRSMHYIHKVALSWSEQDIRTVEQAKEHTLLYNKNCYAVLNAFGIKGRAPAVSEIAYIRRWSEEYGMSLELIVEACNRTMTAIHQPNFEYTESILKNWIKQGVKQRSDIDALDLAYQKEKASKKVSSSSAAARRNSARNKFNNFEGRTYHDMDELTRRLIQSQ